MCNSFLHLSPLTFIKAEGKKYSLIYKTGSVIKGHLIQRGWGGGGDLGGADSSTILLKKPPSLPR